EQRILVRVLPLQQILVRRQRLLVAFQLKECRRLTVKGRGARGHHRERAITQRQSTLILLAGQLIVAGRRLAKPLDRGFQCAEDGVGQVVRVRAGDVIQTDHVPAGNVYELRIGGETRSTLTQDQVEYVLRSELLCELAGGGGVQSRDAVLLHRGAHPLRVQRDVRGHPTDLPSKQRRDPLSVSLRNTTLRRRIGNHDLVAVPDILTGGAGGRRPR